MTEMCLLEIRGELHLTLDRVENRRHRRSPGGSEGGRTVHPLTFELALHLLID